MDRTRPTYGAIIGHYLTRVQHATAVSTLGAPHAKTPTTHIADSQQQHLTELCLACRVMGPGLKQLIWYDPRTLTWLGDLRLSAHLAPAQRAQAHRHTGAKTHRHTHSQLPIPLLCSWSCSMDPHDTRHHASPCHSAFLHTDTLLACTYHPLLPLCVLTSVCFEWLQRCACACTAAQLRVRI